MFSCKQTGGLADLTLVRLASYGVRHPRGSAGEDYRIPERMRPVQTPESIAHRIRGDHV
jgi:hypothetical protein